MAKSESFEVFELPEELTIPLLAAIRLMERAVNPAYQFVLRCGNCGNYIIRPVGSVKGDGKIIGLQCFDQECKRTIKFAKPLDWTADDLPERLRHQPATALTEPGKSKAKVVADPKWIADAFKLVSDGD